MTDEKDDDEHDEENSKHKKEKSRDKEKQDKCKTEKSPKFGTSIPSDLFSKSMQNNLTNALDDLQNISKALSSADYIKNIEKTYTDISRAAIPDFKYELINTLSALDLASEYKVPTLGPKELQILAQPTIDQEFLTQFERSTINIEGIADFSEPINAMNDVSKLSQIERSVNDFSELRQPLVNQNLLNALEKFNEPKLIDTFEFVSTFDNLQSNTVSQINDEEIKTHSVAEQSGFASTFLNIMSFVYYQNLDDEDDDARQYLAKVIESESVDKKIEYFRSAILSIKNKSSDTILFVARYSASLAWTISFPNEQKVGTDDNDDDDEEGDSVNMGSGDTTETGNEDS